LPVEVSNFFCHRRSPEKISTPVLVLCAGYVRCKNTTINKRKPPGGSHHFLIPYSSFLISHFPSIANQYEYESALDEYRHPDIF